MRRRTHSLDPAFSEAAVALGHALLRRGLGLVYGGGGARLCRQTRGAALTNPASHLRADVGLMGVISRTVRAGGGRVIGVLPILQYGRGGPAANAALSSAPPLFLAKLLVPGVIPAKLAPYEVSGTMADDTVVVKDMHERKAQMASHASCFIAMPGGIGTMEEALEMATWKQLGMSAKPVGILNVRNFYRGLLEQFVTVRDEPQRKRPSRR